MACMMVGLECRAIRELDTGSDEDAGKVKWVAEPHELVFMP
jgi:hypothetical protein